MSFSTLISLNYSKLQILKLPIYESSNMFPLPEITFFLSGVQHTTFTGSILFIKIYNQ